MSNLTVSDKLWENHVQMINIFNSADDLCNTFSRYIRLQQAPRFFSVFFRSLDVVGRVNSDSSLIFPVKFLNKLAEEVPYLPVAQINEIWSLCIFNSSELMKKTRTGNRLAYLQFQLTLEVFRVFLFHVKIDTGRTETSIFELFKKTTVFLKEALGMCIGNHSDNFVFPVIGVCHAWGEMNLAMKEYVKELGNQSSFINVSHLYDLSVIHYYFASEDWIDILASTLTSKEVRLHYFVTLLLLQKVRGLILEGQTAAEVVAHICKKLIKFTKVDQFGSWNGEPSHINDENYSIAFWYCFLKHIPCLTHSLRKKHWSYLASRMTEILFTAGSADNVPLNGQTTLTLTKQFLNGPFFLEMRLLQSAYVTEFLRLTAEAFEGRKRKSDCDLLSSRRTIIQHLYSSEKTWMELANTTPKSNGESLNELWEIVNNVSKTLNNVLHLDEKERIDTEMLLKLLKLISYLPLEYLLPGNQIRCLFGLLIFMSCIPSMSKKDDKVILQSLMIEICKIILAVLDGTRSVWLLSFIDISLLLKATVRVASCVLTETDYLSDVQKWMCLLLNSFVSLSMKNVTTLASLRKFIEELASQLHCNDCSENVMVCTILLSRFNDAMRRPHVQPNYEAICREHAELLMFAVEQFIKTKDKIGSQIEMECYKELLDLKCLSSDGNIEILHLKKLIEQELKSLEKGTAAMHDTNIKFFATICKNREVLKSCVPEDFAQKLWFSATKSYTKQLKSDLSAEFKGVSNMSNFNETRENVVKCMIEKCIQKPKGSLIEQFHELCNNGRNATSNSKEAELLKASIKCASAHEYKSIVQNTVDLMNTFSDTVTLTALLQLWAVIVGSMLDTSQKEVLRVPLIDLIKKLFFLHSKLKYPNILEISVHTLDFCSLVLHKGKGLLTHQSVLMCIDLCILTPLQSLVHQPEIYISTFEQVYNVLNEIMIQHLHCVLCAPSCFIACVAYVLSCQIKCSNQNVVKMYDSGMQEKLDLCAQKLCKLMTLISEHKTEFSKLVATIIATYVNETEKVTVFPPIKEHLLIGLNKLIKICDNYFLNVLQKTLRRGSRELFKALLNEHKLYYKYCGHV